MMRSLFGSKDRRRLPATIPARGAASPATTAVSAGRPGQALRVLLGLAAAVIVAVGCARFAGIIGPSVLALVVAICVQPARIGLERLGLRRGFASVVVVVAILALIVSFGLAFALAIGRFATLLPQYSSQIASLNDALSAALQRLGVGHDQAQALLSHLDPAKLFEALTGVVGNVFGLGFGLLLVVGLVVFMALDAAYAQAIAEKVGPAKPDIIIALDIFTAGVRRYMLVTAALGAAVAVLDALTLVLLRVPGAALWGLLAFMTGFIPNIGYWIGLAPAVIFALLAGGWQVAVAVVIIYAVINGVIQSGLQPHIVGTAVSLNQTITFLSVLFWTLVLGPLGAILAVPLTLMVRAVLIDANPDARWLRPVLGDVSGLPRDHKGKKE